MKKNSEDSSSTCDNTTTSAGGVSDSLQDDDVTDSQVKHKRRYYKNSISNLTDQKHQHLEKDLSAIHSAQVLLNEAKEDSSFRRKISVVLKESNKIFVETMTTMGKLFVQMTESMRKSIE